LSREEKTTPLKIRAEGEGDIKILSSLLQDGLVRASDIAYVEKERRFVILFNRYRWEKKKRFLRPRRPERVRSALRFDFVDKAQFVGFKPGDEDLVLNMLSLSGEDGTLLLTFAGKAAVKLGTEVIDITLEDVSDPWPAKSEPRHLS
jgi:hypothetical protein